jgi:hypothetical protein
MKHQRKAIGSPALTNVRDVTSGLPGYANDDTSRPRKSLGQPACSRRSRAELSKSIHRVSLQRAKRAGITPHLVAVSSLSNLTADLI